MQKVLDDNDRKNFKLCEIKTPVLCLDNGQRGRTDIKDKSFSFGNHL